MGGHGLKRWRSEGGAALVEAALVLPFLLLLTFGIWTTARAWNVHNTMEHAAREAARFGATVEPWDSSTSPPAVRAIADADLTAASIDTSVITDCIALVPDSGTACGHTNDTGPDQVVVKLTLQDYELQVLLFGVDVDMGASAISRHEAAP